MNKDYSLLILPAVATCIALAGLVLSLELGLWLNPIIFGISAALSGIDFTIGVRKLLRQRMVSTELVSEQARPMKRRSKRLVILERSVCVGGIILGSYFSIGLLVLDFHFVSLFPSLWFVRLFRSLWFVVEGTGLLLRSFANPRLLPYDP